MHIAEDNDAQLTVLGHMIRSQTIADAARTLGITPEFFVDEAAVTIAKTLEDFVHRHHRHPTPAELSQVQSKAPPDDPRAITARKKLIGDAVTQAGDIGFDCVLPDLRQWRVGAIIATLGNAVADAEQKRDYPKQTELILEAADAIRNVGSRGLQAQTLDSADWSLRERADREAMKGKVTPTGISFVDDVLGGIEPGRVTLVTAKTSVGKSQLLLRMGANAAKAKRRVVLFALEAFQGESQQRLKWGMISAAYAADHRGKQLNPRKWAQGEYAGQIDKYEDAAHEEVKRDFPFLRTLYKFDASYTIDQLEKDVYRVAPDTDLILIDHLQFVDDDGGKKGGSRNIYEGQKEIMERIDCLAKTTGIGIVIAAHIRKAKEGKRYQTLLPDTDDLMGSSDIAKIAPNIIALAPTKGIDEKKLPITSLTKGGSIPTLVQVAKMRGVGGGAGVTQYAAVCHYHVATGRYLLEYDLGVLRGGDTEWVPVVGENVPEWAGRANHQTPIR